MDTDTNNRDTIIESPTEQARRAFVPPSVISQGTLTIQAGSLNLWD